MISTMEAQPVTEKDEQTEQLEQVLVQLDEVWAQLFRQVTAEIREYSFALPLAQVNLLRLLDRTGPQRMSELATRLDVTQSGCTALGDRVLEAGLVERDRDEADRRVDRPDCCLKHFVWLRFGGRHTTRSFNQDQH